MHDETASNYIWEDKKRNAFGLPWCFVRYKLTESKLIIDTGLFTREEDEVWLYRITDVTLKSGFFERLLGLGTIHCCSVDKTKPEFDLRRIKNARKVKEMLSDMIEKERRERRVSTMETISIDDDTFH
ncbi:MAG: PH domain-containing protein [Bacteroidaceae bacterium]|nr:PH domain-containing protein [Bacteroidaceae bacterium]